MLICSKRWQNWETHAYVLSMIGDTLQFSSGPNPQTKELFFILDNMLNPRSTLLIMFQPLKTLFIPINTWNSVSTENNRLFPVFTIYTVRKAGVDHFPHMGAGDTNPPWFVPGLLRAQDQCPPGWQMALMKLDNSAYMHKRMLNIDSEDQRSGAYSTL